MKLYKNNLIPTGRHARLGSFSHGFTLVELLVVISIIALLLAILMPSLQKARMQAKNAVCMSRLKQQGTMFQCYAVENNGVFPAHKHPRQSYVYYLSAEDDMRIMLNEYAGDPDVFYCPMHYPFEFGPDWISASGNTGGWNIEDDILGVMISYSWFANFTSTLSSGTDYHWEGNKKIVKMEDATSRTALASDTCSIMPSFASGWDSSRDPWDWKFRKDDIFQNCYPINGIWSGHPWAAGGINVLYGDFRVEKCKWQDIDLQIELTSSNRYYQHLFYY